MKNLILLFSLLAIISCKKKSNQSDSIDKDMNGSKEMVKNETIQVVNATNVYWGDTHLHTGNSFDVYLFGTPTSTPETAYRFAIGETVTMPTTGKDIKISKPLDFLVIADHAEMVGSIPRLFKNDPILAETKSGQNFIDAAGNQSNEKLQEVYELIQIIGAEQKNKYDLTMADLYKDLHGGEKRRTTWNENNAMADKYNDPGKFTALIGWEWTSTTNGNNLHRVIFTPQNAENANKYLPYSTLESDNPEELWKWLDVTSKSTGAKFTVIPHGSNISNGQFFKEVKFNGEVIDAEYAKNRSKWEKNVEVTQIKGDSETAPNLSPNDEFADYEFYNFSLNPDGATPEPTKADYVRSGLKRGLEIENKVGTNPYKLGMAGGTDSHTGVTSIDEDNFGGKGQHDATPKQRSHPTGIGSSKGWDMGAAGLTGVWATENTRQSIFNSFERKEIYASTGPRIAIRFFGGFDFSISDLNGDYVSIGYKKGVPMGSDLSKNDKAPTFMVKALKDPNGGNLDRIQIIKGWLNTNGVSEEKIYNIALSDGRTDGSIKVGNTVNIKTGKYTNDIGDIQLSAVWTDPDFDATQNAFYYARVLQIPTPRYSLLDAIELGIDPKSTNKPLTIQERVYTSPIWYSSK